MLNPTDEYDENCKLKKEFLPCSSKPTRHSMYTPSSNVSVALKVVVAIVVVCCLANPSVAAKDSGKMAWFMNGWYMFG